MSEYINNDIAMDWNDTIEHEGEFTLLAEGDYDFEVNKFERKRFNGSAKMASSPMAAVVIKVFDKNDPAKGSTTITENLILNRKMEWKLCQFFTALGLRKHGEPLKMNWAAIIGKTGKCKVYIDKYTTDKGEERKNNKIEKFYDYNFEADSPSANSTTFVPGKF